MLWRKQLDHRGLGGGGISEAVSKEERQHYSSLFESWILQELKGIVDLDDLFAYLKEFHPAFADHIAAAVPALTTLLYAHANFPFVTDTPFSNDRRLTIDALLHSLALLTSSCTLMWKQSDTLGGRGPSIFSRSARQRTGFMFSALINPPSGVPTVDDVLDVVSRLEYPKPRSDFSFVRERPICEFVPLAERLLPKDLPKRKEMAVEVETIRSLFELSYAVRGFEKAATDDLLGKRETLRCDHFLGWADSVGVALCLSCK